MAKRKQPSSRNEPLVLMEQNCTYLELIWMIQKIIDAPQEITRGIASFFIVRPVATSQVTAIRASSISPSPSPDQHPLSAVLDDSTSTWWISGPGTMPRGKGREYIEFQLSPRAVCRLSKFSIQIPPLPMGPLSVRRLRLEQRVDHGDYSVGTSNTSKSCWKECSPIWTVENKTGWQEYTLHPPVDVQNIRVVCLTNQMHVVLQRNAGDGDGEDDDEDESDDPRRAFLSMYSCVGYYCVKFE